MNICVIGVGYVGLVAGTCLAESGNDVSCADIDRKKIDSLRKCKIPIYEPGLEELVGRNSKEGRLKFTTELDRAIREAEIIFIAVGTPPAKDGSADLSAVFAVAKKIGQNLNGYKIIVDKSTVPVGTGDRVEQIIKAESRTGNFDVVSNPEFMKEGAAIDDFMKPDRVVIGAGSDRAFEVMKLIYEPFVRNENPIIRMDRRSAEMTKYAANSMLATKISFINEMANICEQVGADIDAVRRGIGFDRRIGFQFLFPGVGYGGSCFPKDVDALIRTALANRYETRVLKAVTEVNKDQRLRVVSRIRSHYGKGIKGKLIAVWGLAFKPNTDDMREAPSVEIIEGILEMGGKVCAYDPVAMEQARSAFKTRIKYGKSPYEAVSGASGLVIVTEWNEFRRPNFTKLRELLKEPVIFDGRNLYEPNLMKTLGFDYYSVGRNPVKSRG
jgi:UDPglucose 6-dehydrogenase